MYLMSNAEVPIHHHVIVRMPSDSSSKSVVRRVVMLSITKLEQAILYETCIKAQMDRQTFVDMGDKPIRIDDILPNMTGCTYIPNSDLEIEDKLGEVESNFNRLIVLISDRVDSELYTEPNCNRMMVPTSQ